jgi:hypothetical protein
MTGGDDAAGAQKAMVLRKRNLVQGDGDRDRDVVAAGASANPPVCQ